MRSAVPITLSGGGTYRTLAIKHAHDESIWRVSVEEHNATKQCDSVRSLCMQVVVVKDAPSSVIIPPTRQGSRSKSVREMSMPGVAATTSRL